MFSIRQSSLLDAEREQQLWWLRIHRLFSPIGRAVLSFSGSKRDFLLSRHAFYLVFKALHLSCYALPSFPLMCCSWGRMQHVCWIPNANCWSELAFLSTASFCIFFTGGKNNFFLFPPTLISKPRATESCNQVRRKMLNTITEKRRGETIMHIEFNITSYIVICTLRASKKEIPTLTSHQIVI